MSQARMILDQRLASGEIDLDEYDKLLEKLIASEKAAVFADRDDATSGADLYGDAEPVPASAPSGGAASAAASEPEQFQAPQATVQPQPEPEPEPEPEQQAEPEQVAPDAGTPAPDHIIAAQAKRPSHFWRNTLIGLGLLLLLAMASSDLWRAPVSGPEWSDAVDGVEQTYVTTGTANVRTAPTSDGTPRVGQLAEGTQIRARRVRDAGEDAQWLEILEGPYTGKFAWEGNFQTLAQRDAQMALEANAVAAAAAAAATEAASPAAPANSPRETSVPLPASPATPATPAPRPTQSLARDVSPRSEGTWARRIGASYPSRAVRRGEEGTVGVQVTVGPSGRVSDCTVTRSSGSTSLDTAACQGMRRYARFNAARDDAGNPTSSTYRTAITYRLN